MSIDIAVVREWARGAGGMLRSFFNRVAAQRKADASWVTEADLAVEDWLRAQISARHPDHGLIGEERPAVGSDREYLWVIDPLDGTGSFVAGLPTWCVSIGLLRNGQPHLGVIYLPVLDDCYWAVADGLAYRNEQPIQVAPPLPLDSGDWIAVPSTVHRAYDLRFSGKVRVLGSIAADCCYVARGAAAGALIGPAKLWDVAAGLAIVAAAGGAVCTLDGRPLETAPLLASPRLPGPILVGHPARLDALRAAVIRRAP